MRSGGLDVRFAFASGPLEPGSRQVTADRASLVVILPPGHRLAKRAELAPADLVGEPFLVTQAGCVHREMVGRAFSSDQAGRPAVVGEVGSVAAIVRMVAAGSGRAVVPGIALSESGGRVTVVPLQQSVEPVPIAMIWRHWRVQTPALRLFLSEVPRRRGGVRRGDARPRHEACSYDNAVAHEKADRVGDVLLLADAADRQASVIASSVAAFLSPATCSHKGERARPGETTLTPMGPSFTASAAPARPGRR